MWFTSDVRTSDAVYNNSTSTGSKFLGCRGMQSGARRGQSDDLSCSPSESLGATAAYSLTTSS